MKFLAAIGLLFSLNTYSQTIEQRQDAFIIGVLITTTQTMASIDLRCEEDLDCALIPMGSKPCGGPSQYVVTSKSNRYLQDVQELAMKVSDKEENFNSRYGRVSDCSVQNPPIAVCTNKLCFKRHHRTSVEASSIPAQPL